MSLKKLTIHQITYSKLTPELILAGAWYILKSKYGIDGGICAGTAMLFQNLRKHTNDLDIQISAEEVSKLPAHFSKEQIIGDESHRLFFENEFVYRGHITVPFPHLGLEIEVPVDAFEADGVFIPNHKFARIQTPASISLLKTILGKQPEVALNHRIRLLDNYSKMNQDVFNNYAINLFNKNVEQYIELTKE